MPEYSDPRCKILFVVPSLVGGGAERVVTIILSYLDCKRFLPVLVLAAGGGPFREHVPGDVRVIQFDAKRVRGAMPALMRVIRFERPNVVFSTLGHLNLMVRMARPVLPRGIAYVARETNIPSINLYNNERPGMFRFLYRWLYPGFDRIVCQSVDMLEDLARNFGIPRKKCIVIPNPVDTKRIGKLARSGKPDLPNAAVNLLACGKLKDQKGFDLLIRAMTELDAAVTLTVLGDGPLRRNLELLSDRCGVSHRVRFLGFSPNPYPYMAACSAFVLSSRYEGFPNVVLEALALGTKVAAFDCPGDVKAILSGLPGCRLAKAEDPADLARAVREVIDARSESKVLVESVRQRFDAALITRRYEAVFEAAAG